MTAADDRLETLETKVAFQEDTIQQLNDALVAQQARIDHLESMVMLLVEQLGALQEPDGPGIVEPPPPHY